MDVGGGGETSRGETKVGTKFSIYKLLKIQKKTKTYTLS